MGEGCARAGDNRAGEGESGAGADSKRAAALLFFFLLAKLLQVPPIKVDGRQSNKP